MNLALIASIGIIVAFLVFANGGQRTKDAITEVKKIKEEIQAFIPKNSETQKDIARTTQTGEGLI